MELALLLFGLLQTLAPHGGFFPFPRLSVAEVADLGFFHTAIIDRGYKIILLSGRPRQI
jgi:hypothetical protein